MARTKDREADLDLRKPKTFTDYLKSSVLFLVVVGLATLLVLQIMVLWGVKVPVVVPPGNLVGPDNQIVIPDDGSADD